MKKLAMILATAVALSTTVPALAAQAPTAEQIEAAQTAADHNAIADAYDAQAKEARAHAKMHDDMAQSYGKAGALPAKGAMATHCKKLSESYNQMAAQYDQLAQGHRDQAAAAQ